MGLVVVVAVVVVFVVAVGGGGGGGQDYWARCPRAILALGVEDFGTQGVWCRHKPGNLKPKAQNPEPET